MSGDVVLKIVVVGDSGVGKSNIILRYTEDRFMESSEPTIGVEFGTKVADYNGRQGQERFRAISSAYYRDANGAVIVYSTTSQSSFDNIEMWLNQVEKHGEPDTHVLVLGNKNDLIDQRIVSEDPAEEFARAKGVQFFETSAKTGDGLEEAFESFIETICSDLADNTNSPFQPASDRIVIRADAIEHPSGGCCIRSN